MTRDELNRIASLLHTPVPPANETPFRAISEIIGFIGKGAHPPAIPEDGLESLTREARARALSAIEGFVAALERAGPPEAHPFRGTTALDLQPTDLARLSKRADRGDYGNRRAVPRGHRDRPNPPPARAPDLGRDFDAGRPGSSALLPLRRGLLPLFRVLFDHVGQARLGEEPASGRRMGAGTGGRHAQIWRPCLDS